MHQTTFDEIEFDREIATDGGVDTEGEHEAPGFDTRDDGKPVVGDEWIGEFVDCSWGYNQTTVDVAQIVDVSDSGRTVIARMAALERVDTARTTEKVGPTGDTYGDEFRLYVRECGDGIVFKGSYPYGRDGDTDFGTHKGSFFHMEREKWQTAPGYGH